MTIKRRFFYLAGAIIAIPVCCAFIILIQRYYASTKRILISGYNEINRMENPAINPDTLRNYKGNILSLPSDVEYCLYTSDEYIVFSNIKEIPPNQNITKKELWNFMSSTSDKYFYQFTSLDKDPKKYNILITRILRERKHPNGQKYFINSIFLMLVVIVFNCIIILIFLAKSIFDSIVQLKKQTEQIAEGNLDLEIDLSKIEEDPNEITAILQSLEKMRSSLLDAQNRKNRFIMGISHDLRTPVAVIKGYTEAIKDGIITGTDEIKTSLDLIETKASQLESMIDSLINFVKLNTYDLRQKMESSSLTKLIKNFCTEAEITGKIYKREVHSNISLSKDYFVPMNEQLIIRVFENLFSNAIRYTKENDSILLKAEINQNNIVFKISDTGIGMSKEDQKHIFDLFYRGTNSRREEGFGVGLSVVKNILDTHGWNIFVESQKHKGTCFTIYIPFTEETLEKEL